MIQAGCVWTCKPCREHRKAYVCFLMTPCIVTLTRLFLYREGNKKAQTNAAVKSLNQKYELITSISNLRSLRFELHNARVWLRNNAKPPPQAELNDCHPPFPSTSEKSVKMPHNAPTWWHRCLTSTELTTTKLQNIPVIIRGVFATANSAIYWFPEREQSEIVTTGHFTTVPAKR